MTPLDILAAAVSKGETKIALNSSAVANRYGCFCNFQSKAIEICVNAGYRCVIKKKPPLILVTLINQEYKVTR